MTLQQALIQARGVLADKKFEEIEAELLLRHLLDLSRAELYSDPDRELTPKQAAAYRKLVARRLNGEPSAYITGHREFFGLDFHVDPVVLIPRPETELLVEKALEIAEAGSIIADIGTGCGAIAIALALQLPEAKIYATDISEDALKVARRNCREHGVTGKVKLLRGGLLEALPETVDIIIANLPYVKTSDLVGNGSLSFEPVLALDGGKDGLDKIRHLCRQAKDKLRPEGRLLLEVGMGQAKQVETFLNGLFPAAQIETFKDLGGIERVVALRLT